MERSCRNSGKNCQCLRTSLSTSAIGNLYCGIFVCHKGRSCPITEHFHRLAEHNSAEVIRISHTTERYGYAPHTHGFPNDSGHCPKSTRHSRTHSRIADSIFIERDSRRISRSVRSWQETWWDKSNCRNRIHQRDSRNKCNTNARRMEQGERPMVSSQIFRTEKNQKGNQSICFEVCQTGSRQAPAPPNHPLSGRSGIRPETRWQAAFPVWRLRKKWRLEHNWTDH